MDDPNGRYHLTETPILSPGVDWLTRSPDGPLIDTGVDIAFGATGRLYLSVETVRQLADVAGLFEGFVLGDAGDAIEVAREEGYGRALKENIIGQLGSIVDELGGIFRAATADDQLPVVPTAPVAGEELPEPNSAPDPEPHSDPEPDPFAGGQAKRPSRSRRPAVVPVDTGNDNPFE